MADKGYKNSAVFIDDLVDERIPDLRLEFNQGDTITQKWFKLTGYFLHLMKDSKVQERQQEARVATAPRIAKTFLVHLLMLCHTEQYFFDLSLEYECGDLELNDLRSDTYLAHMVHDDQEVGKRVELLAYTREETTPLMTDIGHDRPMIVPRDSRGRVVAKHHFLNLPGNHPVSVVRPVGNKILNMDTTPKITDEFVNVETSHQATDEVADMEITPKRPVRLFPEYGFPVIYVTPLGRWVCQRHHRGICKKCNIDYARVALLDGQDASTVNARLQEPETDEKGRLYAVFERNATQKFAAREYGDRLDVYPDESIQEPYFDITYHPNDALSIPLCTWRDSIRYVPQWDHAVVKWDEANLSKLRNGGVVPDKLMPIGDVPKHSCEDCQVTWQVPSQNFHILMGHPSHHTKVGGLQSRARRSMIVHVKGAFLQGNSTTGTSPRASIGVFFAPNSDYNTMAPFNRSVFSQIWDDKSNIGHPGVAMNQTTPVYAAVWIALKQIRWDFLDDRANLVEEEGRYSSNRAVLDAQRCKVIIVTDSKELVDSLSSIPDTYEATTLKGERYEKAKAAAKGRAKAKKKREKGKASAGAVMEVEGHVDWENFTPEDGAQKRVVISKQTGAVVANCDGILAVMRETLLLNVLGISVMYYIQPSNVNLAEPLAKEALNYRLELSEETVSEDAPGKTSLSKEELREEPLSEVELGEEALSKSW